MLLLVSLSTASAFHFSEELLLDSLKQVWAKVARVKQYFVIQRYLKIAEDVSVR